ncbi:hypothetical protein QTO34_015640 [Cnephaeus nilssonii]|uniref:Uncharacterized protein n=1 Tax=Cnephaeus nilssonii TaxID=3371016 RepID=A0AA40LT49_CNENI|nr:hypothetical protein QTO34_015640 [Eptesicus nilssonii]
MPWRAVLSLYLPSPEPRGLTSGLAKKLAISSAQAVFPTTGYPPPRVGQGDGRAGRETAEAAGTGTFSRAPWGLTGQTRSLARQSDGSLLPELKFK